MISVIISRVNNQSINQSIHPSINQPIQNYPTIKNSVHFLVNLFINKAANANYVYVRIIFRAPGGVYKKISVCCHDIHKVAYITLIYRVYYIQ